MVKSSSIVENEARCSKSCKKNTDSLNSKITELTDKLGDSENMGLEFSVECKTNRIENLTNELEALKKEKEGLESKLTGYSAVPPPPAQVYSPPKKDMSWTGLLEFADDTITDYTRTSPSVESNLNDLQSSSSSASENGELTALETQCKKQTVVANFTTEAEYVAASS
nr:hypothetical protein [Tanacetum cinerariifolium]